MEPSLTLEEVAEIVFRTTPDWLSRRWRRLVAEYDFPPPLPLRRNPYLWDPDRIRAWRQGHPEVVIAYRELAAVTPPSDADLEQDRAELRARLDEMFNGDDPGVSRA